MTDLKEIGRFITECRKEKGLTQKALGEKLNVTDRAVSKWETGRSFPDVAILEQLCEELGISVSELLAGKRIDEELYQKETEKMLISSISNAQLYGYQIALHVLTLTAMILVCVPVLLFTNTNAKLAAWISVFACILLTICITYLDKKIPGKPFRQSNRWIEGISGGLGFLMLSVVHLAISGGGNLESTKEKSIVFGWFVFCFIVVIVSCVAIANSRKRQYEQEQRK